MTATSMSPPGYNVLRSFEGRSLRAYKDVVGVWTIGFGNTNSDASVLGFTIGAGVTITAEQADSLLRIAVEKRYEPTVRATFPDASQELFDAATDFVYNIGTGGLAKRSWVIGYKRNKDASGILAYDHAGGKVYAGLTRRRKRELAIINAADYGPEGKATPSELILDKNGKEIGVKPGVKVNAPPPLPAALPPGTATLSPVSSGMLRKGDQGEEVRDLQTMLRVSGYPCNSNGSFDAITEKAMKDFQRAHAQLDVDGVAGPASRAALQRVYDMKSKMARGAVVTGTTTGGVTADQVGGTHFLPTWSVVALCATAVVVLGVLVWQYRDEIVAYAKSYMPQPAHA